MIDKRILGYVNKTWKHHRHELKCRCYKPNLTKEQMIKKEPQGVIPQQWIELVSYWCSDRSKKLSKIGKEAQASQTHVHTTGSRSIAQWRIEFMHKREPRSNLELWKFTHVTTGGGYIDNTDTQKFMDYAENEVAKRVADSKGKSLSHIENDVFNDIMYPNDDSNQRVIGYGFGVTRKQVFRLEKMNYKKGIMVRVLVPVKCKVSKYI